MQEKNVKQSQITQATFETTESDLDDRLLNLLHNTNDSYKAFKTAIRVISAFLEQPQSFE